MVVWWDNRDTGSTYMEKVLTAVSDNSVIHDFCMNYIDPDEKQIIQNRFDSKMSIGMRFTDEKDLTVFCAVIDFEPHESVLHVREVGGTFPHAYTFLDNFCQGLAQYLGYNHVTFNTERNAVKRFAKKAGYHTNDGHEFIKSLEQNVRLH